MLGPSSDVMFELRRVISDQKWANAPLVLTYIELGWFIIVLSWRYFGETGNIQALLAREKELVATKGKKQTLLQLT